MAGPGTKLTTKPPNAIQGQREKPRPIERRSKQTMNKEGWFR